MGPLSVVQATGADQSRAAVEAAYLEQGDRLWRAVWAYAQDPDIASDAVAEAFAQALARGSAIRSPSAWVWRAAFRIAAGMLTERRRNIEIDQGPNYEMSDPSDGLLWALQQLPRRQRAALILFYYADQPLGEVATILQSSLIAARVNLSRGRKRLRQILEAAHD